MNTGKEGKTIKKRRRGTKKNNVTLRERLIANNSISLYLSIYVDGVRTYEYLKMYLVNKNPSPIERQGNKETLAIAENIRTQRENDLNNSIHKQIAPGKQKTLFIEFAQSYIDNYTKKDHKMIKGAIERFKSFMGVMYPKLKITSLKLSQIDKIMIIDYVDYLKSKSIGEGAHGYFQRFKKVLKNAVDKKILTESPADGITCKVEEGLKKDILSNKEIQLLAKTPCQNDNIKRAFIFSCCTGLRFCDVNTLTFSNIDFSTGKMTVDQQKTGKLVNVDLNTTAIKIIGEPGKPKDLVFELPSSTGCAKTVKAWVNRAGIKKHITWHCARHSFAVNLLTSKNKPDIKTVSSTLGHTTLRYTEKYTRVVDELKKKAVNALPDYDL